MSRICLLFGLTALFMSPQYGVAAAPSASTLLPETVALYAEIERPADLIKDAQQHRLWGKAKELEGVRKGLNSPDYLKFQVGKALVESQLGQTVEQALAGLTEQGIAVAFDAKTQGAAILLHARDAATLNTFRDKVLKFARDDAKNKGKDLPFEEVQYRDVTFYKTKEGGFATVQDWLIVVNKGDLAKGIVDHLLDGSTGGLAESRRFQQARQLRAEGASLWLYGDIGMIRDAGSAPKLYGGKANDAGGELLAGGILEVLKSAEFLSGSLKVTNDNLQLLLALPHEKTDVSEQRWHFFGEKGTGTAPPMPKLGGTLATLSAYRDLSQMWLRAGDLFDANTNDKLAKADSDLSTLFGGKDFGEDILGSFEPGLRIIAVRQQFAIDQPTPAIKLPAFAVLFDMKEAATSQRELRRNFQSLVGFLNFAGVAEGAPQLELDMQQEAGVEIVSSSYVLKEGDSTQNAPIHFNFSPTVAFKESRFVLASTRELARQIAAAEYDKQEAANSINSVLQLHLPSVQEALADNQSHLISQNMLEKGHTRDEASREVGDLMQILSWFTNLSVDLVHPEGALKLNVNLEFTK